MTCPRIPETAWHRSSYSSSNGGECVEVAFGRAGLVPVRDSKSPDQVVAVSVPAWSAFVAALRSGGS
ncbi:DUF397 domain-containing protein [Streptomyces sp. 7-21]|jgi:hypothetical protein|uniref:DUF397 domain-containing protein n=1 Tax=Streptomyces sp. 7-21 TaxID=2802283 RepID=UPI00191CA6A3|nr:DUF397 domain-containing protein [Streptomyces sp. 7-21]MBL1065217.1 DUF397 domain-containing protein [Streptomyces sp. 7-21]